MSNISEILESLTNGHKTIDPFDKRVGGLLGGNALTTKPTTLKEIEPLTGEAQTFIVQTVRTQDEHEVWSNSVILEFVAKEHVRLILPSKVVNTIMRQGESLSARQRSAHAKRVMKERMDAGYKPTPPPPGKRKRRTKKKRSKNAGQSIQA